MKKKKWWIPVTIVVSLVFLCAIGFGIYCMSFYMGTYVKTQNGGNMVIFDDNPIVLSDRTNRDLFEGLETGDRVLAIHGFIEETYPARSEAKVVFKLGKGSIDDIPQKVIDDLTEMGWLEGISE